MLSSSFRSSAWNELLAPAVVTFAKPLMVSIINVVAPTEVYLQPSTIHAESGGPISPPATPGLTTLRQSVGQRQVQSMTYSDTSPRARASFSSHAHPVRLHDKASIPSPSNCSPTYYAIASSNIYFVRKAIAEGGAASQPASLPEDLDTHGKQTYPRGYTLQLLCTFAQPQSTCALPLSRHLQDVVQSFVDLQVLARERWSFSELDGKDVSILPWHLAAVELLAAYDMAEFNL